MSNPLHRPIPSDRVSAFSTLGGHNNRLHVPILPWEPNSKWKSSMVTFSGHRISFNRAGAPADHGVPVSYLTAYSDHTLAQVVQNGSDVPFADTNTRKITLRIVWPGYEALNWAQPLELMPMGIPVTRSQLAAQVASHYSAYIAKAGTMPSSEADWRVSAALFEKLIVVAIHNVFDDIWQADIVIDTH